MTRPELSRKHREGAARPDGPNAETEKAETEADEVQAGAQARVREAVEQERRDRAAQALP
jgi:hypothetical protein